MNGYSSSPWASASPHKSGSRASTQLVFIALTVLTLGFFLWLLSSFSDALLVLRVCSWCVLY